jgi:site-specific DNA-methyltransferase (adenine-specific)
MSQASFTLQGHNPDVLTCIANLSNDEVFTPPEFANQMLDSLEQSWAASNGGESIWANKEVTFLDPCTKSGVFLREIVKRLNDGLTKEIPDLTERINHILTKQVFGIGITELTSLLARRSVYCSKHANGIHSIARTFTNNDGNIWFERTEHTWINGKCKFCGASKSEYGRSEELETHAYKFIHSIDFRKNISELFGEHMHFDVIIGNPPYQLSDGGFGTSAVPIYQNFVEQAKKLEPRFLTMVVPARWFSGGRGLDKFRESMLNDNRLRKIDDFPDSNDVFPGTQIKGGICFFLWDRDHQGLVQVTTHSQGLGVSSAERPLLEPGVEVFIRYNPGVGIVQKISRDMHNPLLTDKKRTATPNKAFSLLVSPQRPFGLRTFYKGKKTRGAKDLILFENGGSAYVPRSEIAVGTELIDSWKVFIPAAGSGSDSFPHSILGRPFVGSPGSVCTETYLCLGPLNSEKEAENLRALLSTRFLRFLVLLHKPTQHVSRSAFSFVPMITLTTKWTDEKLYEKYGITEDEIAFIESMIRPMELDSE